jgi:hypothetical protein
MTPIDQFVHDNAGPIYLMVTLLFLIYCLLLEQALIAMDDKRKSMGRALRGWLRRRK